MYLRLFISPFILLLLTLYSNESLAYLFLASEVQYLVDRTQS